MEHEEREVEATDGTRLHVDLWRPDTVRFVVVISHGQSEHMRRWEHVAARLGARGALVFGPDHRGEGRSGGPRGHVTAFEQYAGDLLQVMRRVAMSLPADQRPGTMPWFILGHSVGGLAALLYLLDHSRALPLRGAVISTPFLGNAVRVNPLKVLAAKVAARIAPEFSQDPGLPPEHISRDPEEVARYAADSDRTRVLSAAWAVAMERAFSRIAGEVGRLALPMLWYAGTADRIADFAVTKKRFEALVDPDANDQTFVPLDGYYHEPHNEPAELREPVLQMLEDWLDARVPAADATE